MTLISPLESLRTFPLSGGRHLWPGKADSTVAVACAAPVPCGVGLLETQGGRL